MRAGIHLERISNAIAFQDIMQLTGIETQTILIADVTAEFEQAMAVFYDTTQVLNMDPHEIATYMTEYFQKRGEQND